MLFRRVTLVRKIENFYAQHQPNQPVEWFMCTYAINFDSVFNKTYLTDRQWTFDHCLKFWNLRVCWFFAVKWINIKSDCLNFYEMKNSILLLPSFLSVILAQVDFASICKLPPVRGNCQAALDMWYFNAATDQCEPFTFSGCNGNANKFGNKEDCERICKLRIQRVETQDNIHPITENYVQDCSAPKDAGVQCTRFARAVPNLQYRWYWNQEKFSCLSFKYNGCGGNTNNFATHTLCTKRCQPSK